MTARRGLWLWLPALLLVAAAQASRFESRDGRILVLAGQSLDATFAYLELPNTPLPAGWSDYISYAVGAPYKPFAPSGRRHHRGNDGLLEPTNWGAGNQCVACPLRRAEFATGVINIGLYLAGPEAADGSQCRGRDDCTIARLARGEFDARLGEFARWLRSLGPRPVLLRVGYEFDGPWNNYDPQQFRAGWKYLHRFLREAAVDNVAFVYHSHGFASYETLEAYWPSADADNERYVDWIGYSYFQMDPDIVGREERRFARDRGLKVFLGEVAPHTGDCSRQIDLAKDTALGQRWMANFFRHVEAHRDVVRAIAYINEDWSDRQYAPQWQAQQDQSCGGFFARSNSRLNDNPVLEKQWAEYISAPRFLNGGADLYRQLLGVKRD